MSKHATHQPSFSHHYWMMFAIVTGCDGRLWSWAHSWSMKTRRQRWIFHSVERLLYSREHVGAGRTPSRRPRRRLRKKISRSSSRRWMQRDLLLYSRMPLELRAAPYLASSLLRRGLFVLWGGFCVVGRLGRKKKRARGARWEGGREKRGLCHIMCGSLARFAVLWQWRKQAKI